MDMFVLGYPHLSYCLIECLMWCRFEADNVVLFLIYPPEWYRILWIVDHMDHTVLDVYVDRVLQVLLRFYVCRKGRIIILYCIVARLFQNIKR